MPTIFEQNPALTAVVCAAVVLLALLAAMALLRRKEAREREAMEERILDEQAEMLDRLREAMFESARGAREGQEQSLRLLNQTMSASATARQLSDASMAMETRQERMRQTLDERLAAITALNDAKLEQMRRTVDERLDGIARLNDQKLEQMRQTVSEKLESTLENRLGESFKAVNEQLSRVYKGLGEMQSLAQGVGDLKKVLTNVKTRGVWGEVRLRALLEDCLSPGQYLENAQVTPGSMERVEFAIRLPAADGEGALLPVDSKFPQEDYLRLVEAAQAGDAEGVRAAQKQLENAVREQARRISDKYIKPPATTDYAVLFLPCGEPLRRGGARRRPAGGPAKQVSRAGGRAFDVRRASDQLADGLPHRGAAKAQRRGARAARRGEGGIPEVRRGGAKGAHAAGAGLGRPGRHRHPRPRAQPQTARRGRGRPRPCAGRRELTSAPLQRGRLRGYT